MKGLSSNCERDSCKILIKDIEEMIKNLKPPTSSNCFIYRVPNNFRKRNEEACTTIVVFVDPFHHCKKKELQPMEKFKLRCMQKVHQWTIITIRELFDTIKLREDILNCYAETINISSNRSGKIILVDVVFVIASIVQVYYDSKGGHDSVLEKNF